MKKGFLVFVTFFTFSVFCFAQNKVALNHFWDIPWGTSMEQAEAIFNERGFNTIREDNTLITQASYEREEAFIMLIFNRVNRLYSASVIYPASGTTVLPKYDNYR